MKEKWRREDWHGRVCKPTDVTKYKRTWDSTTFKMPNPIDFAVLHSLFKPYTWFSTMGVSKHEWWTLHVLLFFMGVCTRRKLGFSILTVYKSKPPENPAWITYPLPPYTLLFHLQYITCVELHVGLLWRYHGMDMILNVSSLRWPGSAVWTILIDQWSWLWDDRDRFSDQTS